jgi:hypothetical protein
MGLVVDVVRAEQDSWRSIVLMEVPYLTSDSFYWADKWVATEASANHFALDDLLLVDKHEVGKSGEVKQGQHWWPLE